ncbi:hypothetical protein QYF61_023445 [Mycteria americana]|uniref:Uncharacterized protein n=1 Tax=Mycteria americana TaxID=33587 RepID=A0AAN7NBW1_MYCAM|nr:hypothetical protein QYF61_023445 [Mycteria americana]
MSAYRRHLVQQLDLRMPGLKLPPGASTPASSSDDITPVFLQQRIFADSVKLRRDKREVFHPSDHFCGPPLDLLQQVHVFPVLRAPELDAVLQVGSHQSRVEGQNHLPRPAGHASFDAAQDTVGLLGCEHTVLAHVQLFTHQYPQVLLSRAALNPLIPQPVLIPGVALTQVQDLALGLVEPHEVHTGPLLQLVQVPLDDIPSFRHVNCTTQLGVICKLAEGALDPTLYIIDEDIKQYWSQITDKGITDTTTTSNIRDRQQAYLRAQHAQRQVRFGSAAGLLRERKKLLPTDNHLWATEKTDHVPSRPGGKYCIFLQTEKTQLGQAYSPSRTEEAEDMLTLLGGREHQLGKEGYRVNEKARLLPRARSKCPEAVS